MCLQHRRSQQTFSGPQELQPWTQDQPQELQSWTDKSKKYKVMNLPPELVERINKPQKNRLSLVLNETSSGGFVPYGSMTRRSRSIGATSLPTAPSISFASENSHWLTRNQVNQQLLQNISYSTICDYSGQLKS